MVPVAMYSWYACALQFDYYGNTFFAIKQLYHGFLGLYRFNYPRPRARAIKPIQPLKPWYNYYIILDTKVIYLV